MWTWIKTHVLKRGMLLLFEEGSILVCGRHNARWNEGMNSSFHRAFET
ncbi:hypothetical protein HMPREF3214_00465 [Alloscardovia omnicolens]|nr:hypothetical protein HMPREF3214_00465 [Alloscardovia omnicolens]